MSEAVATRSAAATRRVAGALARALAPPCVVLLRGDLGAGKTTFVQGFVASLRGGAPLRVTSPTYALARTYETTPRVHHLDLYRLEDESVAHDLGLLEMVDDPEALVVIEWPERAPSLADRARTLVVDITGGASRYRRLTFSGLDALAPEALDTLRAASSGRG